MNGDEEKNSQTNKKKSRRKMNVEKQEKKKPETYIYGNELFVLSNPYAHTYTRAVNIGPGR